MLTFEEFEGYINLIKDYCDRDDKMSELLNTQGFIMYSGPLTNAIVELLEITMDDQENKWIQYWLWDSNFGETATAWGKNGDEIPLKTLEDLYEVLNVASNS